ncbi:MAG: hypothetical protein EBU84_03180 [Actinobacteria bacterium]|nr:hypothetical protein [Actinomycetota bacterium]
MSNLNIRKWTDRLQPQTLQIATFLLYINGFFAFVSVLDKTDYLGYFRYRWGVGILVGLFVVAANIFGGFLMANDRKSGYWLAIVAAFAPFALRYWALSDLENLTGGSVSLWDKFTGGDTIGFIFEAALCALLLHPQSREHQRLWFR